jgi:tetratricopeptide (TPR) repeat protein
LSRQQHIEQQIQDIHQELKEKPEDAGLLHDLGVGYFLLGQYGNAIIQLKKASTISPVSATYRFNLANAYSENEQYEKAVNTYLETLDLKPDHVPSLNNLADCYELLGQPEKAHELFQYLVKISPDNPLSHFNLGNFFIRQNQHIEAVKCYEQAIERDASFVDAYYNIAWVLQQAKAWKKALEYSEKGLRIAPEHPELVELKNQLQDEITSQ